MKTFDEWWSTVGKQADVSPVILAHIAWQAALLNQSAQPCTDKQQPNGAIDRFMRWLGFSYNPNKKPFSHEHVDLCP